MSIATAIQNAQNKIAAAYTACNNKGATMPTAADQNLSHLANTIDSIQTGGGGHTGTVDTAGLQALGWDSYDIQWLQDHVWWDAEDDAEWAVTEANKAFGPTGATPLTWSNYSAQKYNADLRYFPKLTTPTGTSMASKFNGYVHLVAIPTHGWDMSAIKNYEQCFRNDSNLRSIGDTDYWVTSQTTTLWLMFTSCAQLKTINVAHWDTSNVTTMSSCLEGCRSLVSIDLSGWSFVKSTAWQSMLNACYELQEVKLPATISAPALTGIMSFLNTTAIEKIELTLTAASLTTVQSIFNGCSMLRRAKLSIASTVLSNLQTMCFLCGSLVYLDLTGIDTTGCNQTSLGGNNNQSPFGTAAALATIKLGANFFKGSFTTLYANQCYSWTRDSIYESLYTNQTSRSSSSPAVTINLAAAAYDRLSASDLSDIATKNFTLTRV